MNRYKKRSTDVSFGTPKLRGKHAPHHITALRVQRGRRAGLVLVRDAALTRHRTHPVTVAGPDGVIVRVLRQVRGQFWPRHAAAAAWQVHTGPVRVCQHVVVHQVSALPGWSERAERGGGVAKRRNGGVGWAKEKRWRRMRWRAWVMRNK